MKNSIHDFYARKHESDPKLSFEDCTGKRTNSFNKLSTFLAVAASVLAVILLIPMIERGTPEISDPDDSTTSQEQATFLAAQAFEPEQESIRPAPTNPTPRGERILPIATVSPEYPQAAVTQHIEGWIVISMTVSAEGEVLNPFVEDAEPQGVFDESALTAIRQFTFRPQVVDGQPTEVSGVQYLFRYHLDDGE